MIDKNDEFPRFVTTPVKGAFIRLKRGGKWMDEEMTSDDTIVVPIGSHHSVIINKDYGPLIFTSLRITPDVDSNSWVIEREVSYQDSEGNGFDKWVEWVRIPGWNEEEEEEIRADVAVAEQMSKGEKVGIIMEEVNRLEEEVKAEFGEKARFLKKDEVEKAVMQCEEIKCKCGTPVYEAVIEFSDTFLPVCPKCSSFPQKDGDENNN